MRLLLCLGALLASAHTYHSSIAQVEYIAARRAIEVMVFLHTEDLERLFQEQHGRQANFEPAADAFVQRFLQKAFVVRDAQGRPVPQKWVGLELKVHFAVAYFELPAPQGPARWTLTNRIFLDRLPDQLNTAQIKLDGKPVRELVFDRSVRPATQPLLP